MNQGQLNNQGGLINAPLLVLNNLKDVGNQNGYFLTGLTAMVGFWATLSLNIPVVPGIMPITNYSKLVRFSDACGAEIPRWIRKQLEAYGDDTFGWCDDSGEPIGLKRLLISPTTMMSASVKRVIMPSNTLLPTPVPAKRPRR